MIKMSRTDFQIHITHTGYHTSIRQSKFLTDHKAAEVGPHHTKNYSQYGKLETC